jgi:hypothetical protein
MRWCAIASMVMGGFLGLTSCGSEAVPQGRLERRPLGQPWAGHVGPAFTILIRWLRKVANLVTLRFVPAFYHHKYNRLTTRGTVVAREHLLGAEEEPGFKVPVTQRSCKAN